MIGLSLVFFLSTVYAHSGKLLISGLLAISVILLFISGNLDSEILYSLPSLSFFLTYSENQLLFSLVLVIIPSILSLIFLKVNLPPGQKELPKLLFQNMQIFGFLQVCSFCRKRLA